MVEGGDASGCGPGRHDPDSSSLRLSSPGDSGLRQVGMTSRHSCWPWLRVHKVAKTGSYEVPFNQPHGVSPQPLGRMKLAQVWGEEGPGQGPFFLALSWDVVRVAKRKREGAGQMGTQTCSTSERRDTQGLSYPGTCVCVVCLQEESSASRL